MNVIQTYAILDPDADLLRGACGLQAQGRGAVGRYLIALSSTVERAIHRPTSARCPAIPPYRLVPRPIRITSRSTDGATTYNLGMRLTSATQQNKSITGSWARYKLLGDGAAIVNATAQMITRGATGTPGSTTT